MTERAVPHVRKFLGQRLRTVRKDRGLSQEGLGARAGLSGKFIGEVERGAKSISLDSLYHVAVALGVPLRYLADVRSTGREAPIAEEMERILALVATRHRPAEVRRAYAVLRAMFGPKS